MKPRPARPAIRSPRRLRPEKRASNLAPHIFVYLIQKIGFATARRSLTDLHYFFIGYTLIARQIASKLAFALAYEYICPQIA